MRKRITRLIGALALGMAASGAALAASPSAVLKACIGGAPSIQGGFTTTTGLDASGQYARLNPGPNVSPQLASAVNACADRNGGNTGVVLAAAGGGAAIDLERQRQAILLCKRLRFIGGETLIIERKDAAGSPMQVEIAPSDQVTTVDADVINRCAAARLGLSQAEIRKIGLRQRTIVRSIRAPGGYYNANCGRNPSILYKGDLYCQWARR